MIHRVARKRRAVLRHPLVVAALLGSALVVAFAISGAAVATTVGAPICTNTATLNGSRFEIDTDANLIVNTGTCIDWLTGGTGTSLRTGVLAKPDKASGSGDDAFGQGTSENDANPTIVDGSIPPNKSDLKVFGLYQESGEATITPPNPTGKFLELFWARVQNPSGTTNMDFELNQKFCDPTATTTNCANNSKDPSITPETPIRTAGDKLITYDLSKGGTVPTISIRTWLSTGVWGPATVISTGGPSAAALGSVNTSAISSADAGGDPPAGVGSLDPFTFGEASITFGALFGTSNCGKFGSAYLKSRSSDSFTSEIKDFIGPQHVNISNCTGLTTSATNGTIGGTISDTAILSGASSPTGAVTFDLYKFAANATPTASSCTGKATNTAPYVTSISTSTWTLNSTTGNYEATVTYPTSGTLGASDLGQYRWIATFAGDGSNSPAGPTGCIDTGERSDVTKLPSTIGTAQSYYPNDTATITGTGSFDGTVAFELHKTSDCSDASVYGEASVALSGTPSGSTASTSNSSYAADANNTGPFYWKVTYSGDSTHRDVSACVETSSVSITNGGTTTSP
jgi:hypothetical protein